MIHVDPETLRRYPILGVLLGLVTVVVIGYLIHGARGEMRTLVGQEEPDRLTVSQAVNLGRVRWVTVSDGEWHCAEAAIVERKGTVERWVLGRIDAVEVPLTGERPGELLVARFDGDISCAERSASPLTGVIGSSEIFGVRSSLRRWARPGKARVEIMSVGSSPTTALLLFLAVSGIFLLGVGFLGYYGRLLLRRRGPAEPNPSWPQPIEPK